MSRYCRLIASVLLIASALLSLRLPGTTFFTAAAAESCEYVLGFKSLYDLVPDTIGECIDNVSFSGTNGDALQHTQNGLLVWRKADNFTAFTDGYRTWVNGPFGIQQRLNIERFEWENDGGPANPPGPPPSIVAPRTPVSSSSCSLPADTVKFDKFVPDYGGAALGQGTVSNPCDEPVNLAIDVFANVSDQGAAVMDAPTIWVSNLAPHTSRTVAVRVPGSASGTHFSWQFARVGSSQWCLNGSTPSCAWVDPELSSAFKVLTNIEEGKPLVAAAATNRIRVMRGDVPDGVLGYYSASTKTIIISREMDRYSSWVRATILGHELQHAADYPASSLPAKGAECYEAEGRAFRTGADIWNRLWQGRLPRDVDSIHTQLNDDVRALAKDPEAFGIAMSVRYGRQCGDSASGG